MKEGGGKCLVFLVVCPISWVGTLGGAEPGLQGAVSPTYPVRWGWNGKCISNEKDTKQEWDSEKWIKENSQNNIKRFKSFSPYIISFNPQLWNEYFYYNFYFRTEEIKT